MLPIFLQRLFACLITTLTCTTIAHTQNHPIKIGVIENLSGALAQRGTAATAIYQQRIEDINKGGGLRGHKLELLICDAGSSSDRASTCASKLASDDKVNVALCAFTVCEPKSEETKVPFILTVGSLELKDRRAALFLINAPGGEDYIVQSELAINALQSAIISSPDIRPESIAASLRIVNISTPSGNVRFDDKGNNVGLVTFQSRAANNPAAAGCRTACDKNCPRACGNTQCTKEGSNQCCDICGRPREP